VSWNVQVATWTSNNRYPGIFRTARRRIAAKFGSNLGEGKLRILSFGCSTGSEVSTLRSYFPNAMIFACDVNASALQSAAELLLLDEAVIFMSSPEEIEKYGPFDIIFAMSVLCRFPESMDQKLNDLNAIYRFSDFERTINILSGSLRKGGLLCLYNTNYSFLELPLAKGYRIVRSPLIGTGGFVDRFDSSGQRLTLCEHKGPYYVHRIHRRQSVDETFDFTASIFEEDGNETSDIDVPVSTESPIIGSAPAHLFRFGPDLNVCAEQGLIATALGYWFEDGADDPHLIRAWHSTTPSGQIRQGKSWVVKTDIGIRDVLSVGSAREMQSATHAVRSSYIYRTIRTVKKRLRAQLA
jgi:SAM-dependent methyltransferase